MNSNISRQIDEHLGSVKDSEVRHDEACIVNPYNGIELLTPMQAIDAINFLSGALLADGCICGQTKHNVDLRTPESGSVCDLPQMGGDSTELFQERAARDAEQSRQVLDKPDGTGGGEDVHGC